ncbi:MAG: hypothetical protein Q8M54_01450 [Desulfobaccales bacterium]|nr:hypothetical protein [Desulfobaccales bacterium]
MTPKRKQAPFFLLVANDQTRNYLLDLLKGNNYFPEVMPEPSELIQILKKQACAIVFADCETIALYGAGIFAKVKVACPNCKIVLFGDRAHLRNKSHRDLIKEAMDIGVYACILAPYEEWEVLSMARYLLIKENQSRLTERQESED